MPLIGHLGDVRLCSFRWPAPKGATVVNTCSHSNTWSRGLSPFVLGPVDLYLGHTAKNVENAWQYSKVYPEHVDKHGDVTQKWWEWAKQGWAKDKADRYPMGKGAIPLYSYWLGRELGYIEARKRIYCPLYSKAVDGTPAYLQLKDMAKKEVVYLWDYDAYDHIALKLSYKEVLNNPTRKMGHAFVLAMMLCNQREWE